MIWRRIIFFFMILISLQKCATQTQPMGGPKDTIPPILVSSLPENNQKNFKGKTVTLTFDEFIKLKDQKEIIITPNPGKNTNITAKGAVITIQPKNTWKDSTTYSIAFRDAIQDVTESNPVRNLHLAFSTGPVIDSLSISGSIHLALKETIPDRITVALYQQDTFNIFKHNPTYFTESNKEGFFKINNLKPGTYHIYAFADKNKNLRADSQSELYGFRSDTISLTRNREQVNLYLITADARKLRVTNVRHNALQTIVKLSKGVNRYTLNSMEGPTLTNSFGDNFTEIFIYHNKQLHDSVAYHLETKDSLSQQLDTIVFVEASDARFQKEKFKVTIASTSLNTETGNLSVNLKFNIPLLAIQTDTMQITIDSTSVIKIEPHDILQDTIVKQAVFTCTVSRKKLNDIESPLDLFFSKGLFISINNDSSTALSTKIPYIKEEETGKLSIEIHTETPHFIIQIIDKDYKVIQESRDQKMITFSNLLPADYKIRAIIDTNNNGKWDFGSYYDNLEPEKIIYLKITPKTYDTPLRANWEATAPPFSF